MGFSIVMQHRNFFEKAEAYFRAYRDVISCFRDKIDDCGDNRQKRMLSEVQNMIKFFCQPGSESNRKF